MQQFFDTVNFVMYCIAVNIHFICNVLNMTVTGEIVADKVNVIGAVCGIIGCQREKVGFPQLFHQGVSSQSAGNLFGFERTVLLQFELSSSGDGVFHPMNLLTK